MLSPSGVILVVVALTTTGSVAFAQTFSWNWRKMESAQAKLEASGLSPSDQKELRVAIISVLKADGLEEDEIPQTLSRVKLKLADLNADHTPEVIVQGGGRSLCGATGNCQTWVFEKVEGKYRSILKGGDSFQSFSIQALGASGYRDLVFAQHDSATRQIVFLYRFRSGSYEPTGCYIADWQPDINQPVLKEPRLAACH